MDKIEQFNIFGGVELPRPKPINKEKRDWENGFQRWSDKQAEDGTTPLGKCGYGYMCDYCEDNTYGRPCVRALNEVMREKRKTIDYGNKNYEEIWEGDGFI